MGIFSYLNKHLVFSDVFLGDFVVWNSFHTKNTHKASPLNEISSDSSGMLSKKSFYYTDHSGIVFLQNESARAV